MNFGPQATEEESHGILDKALQVGVNFFDTADVYGWKRGEGWTEQIIGRWLTASGRRDQVVLATKCYNVMGEGPNDRGLSGYHIRSACEASLKRLQTDHIDLYQMHHIERSTPWDEIWQAMELLVQQGKVIYVGSSNFAGWDIATANQTAKQRNFLGLVSEQSKYSLVTRMVELEVVPACRHYGLGLIPYSPLESGLLGGVLGGKYRSEDKSRRATEGMQKRMEELRPQLEKYEALCKEVGEDPADVALAWLLANPVITAPIIGPRTLDQLTGALRALDVQLSTQTMERLNEIWPGPGGEAPQAYAW